MHTCMDDHQDIYIYIYFFFYIEADPMTMQENSGTAGPLGLGLV